MPTAPISAHELAANAAAVVTALVNADATLAPQAAALLGAIRAKYPNVNVGPGGGIDPGVVPAT